jgi:DNA-binding transcriptional ArsR family regulator
MGSMQDMDAVFKALGEPARRRLLDRLNAHNGLTLTELCADMGMTRQSVTKHLAVLETAELVTTLRRGREKLHFLNAAPINDIADRWIHHYDRTRAQALSDLKTALEAIPMDQTTFVYTTYIHATPEKVWNGLTDPAFTTRYWRHPKASTPSRSCSSPTPIGDWPTRGTPSRPNGRPSTVSTRRRRRRGAPSRARKSPSTSRKRAPVW